MIAPALPANEAQRLVALDKLDILDTLPEKEYDKITKLTAYICQTPVCLISLVGKEQNWFKSAFGTEIGQSDREYSHCGHTILEPGSIMEVQDARKDERFKDNPFTLAEDPILFYSGAPIVDHYGHALGTLCVLDHVPRKLSQDQKDALKCLADQISNLFELRIRNNHLRKVQTELEEQNALLKNFASTVSHDMKMPLANIIVTIDFLKAKYGKNLNGHILELLKNIKDSSFSLSDYVSGILEHYESDTLTSETSHEQFDLHDLLEDIIDFLNITEDCEINFPDENTELVCNKIVLNQILLNLINNSLKYNDKEEIIINIDFKESEDFYHFKIADNGIGIPEDKQASIFTLFSTAADTDRSGKKGNGIGLSTVKKLINNFGGTIEVSSKVKEGTTFDFTIKKPSGPQTS